MSTDSQTDPTPTGLTKPSDDRLRIEWSDGETREYRVRDLRDRCPCATCREKRSAPAPDPMQLTVLAPEETQPLAITGMKPVGNYAYNIRFSDGHSTGLFTLKFLRELGKSL